MWKPSTPTIRKLKGTIKYDRPEYCLLLYRRALRGHHFHVGDYLTATIKDPFHGVFNIEQQLIRFFVEDTRQTMDSDDSYMLAMVIDEQKSYCAWLTETGVAVRIEAEPKSNNHSWLYFAFITITDYGSGNMMALTDKEAEGRYRRDIQ